MAAAEETVDLLDPSNSSKNTLKLENVCTLRLLQVSLLTSKLDEKSRHSDCDREEISSPVES
jgi:hypothetical protein